MSFVRRTSTSGTAARSLVRRTSSACKGKIKRSSSLEVADIRRTGSGGRNSAVRSGGSRALGRTSSTPPINDCAAAAEDEAEGAGFFRVRARRCWHEHAAESPLFGIPWVMRCLLPRGPSTKPRTSTCERSDSLIGCSLESDERREQVISAARMALEASKDPEALGQLGTFTRVLSSGGAIA